MRDIQDFAHAPQQSTGRYTNNTAIEPGIIKYLEDESDLRPFFVNKPMQGVLSKSFNSLISLNILNPFLFFNF